MDPFDHADKDVIGRPITYNYPARLAAHTEAPRCTASRHAYRFAATTVIGLLFLFSLTPFDVLAQDADSLVFGPEATASRTTRVFLDCQRCDEVYLRREIPFVDYVRDRQDADVHLLVTQQATGGGGLEYVLNFIGQKRHLGSDQILVYVSPSEDTADERRAGMAQRMKLGLIPYVAQTPVASQLIVDYRELDDPFFEAQDTDPWRRWVFEIEGNASVNGEASQRSLSTSASAAADRVTDSWKIQTRLYGTYRQRRFERSGGEKITSTLTSRQVVNSVVYSVAEHWSAGLFGRAYTSTFENIDFGLRLAPAVEYSVFPYEESSRRELTISYRVGYQSLDYIEQTIFGERSEVLSNQSLTGRLRIQQPWGNVFLFLEGSHYMHDLSKNRLEFFSNLNLRVFRGLSLRVSGGMDVIHDQLYLPAGEGTLEDLLLQQKQLATTYEYRLAMGVSYTFGSIYSNVVNTRL